jgi:hypothetical protein
MYKVLACSATFDIKFAVINWNQICAVVLKTGRN